MTIGQFRPITTHPKVPWQQHSRKSMRPRCIPVEKSLRCCGDHAHLGRHRAGLIMHEPKPTHSSPPHPAAHIACMETQDGHVSLVAANTECQVNKKRSATTFSSRFSSSCANRDGQNPPPFTDCTHTLPQMRHFALTQPVTTNAPELRLQRWETPRFEKYAPHRCHTGHVFCPIAGNREARWHVGHKTRQGHKQFRVGAPKNTSSLVLIERPIPSAHCCLAQHVHW
jgi:hypothetical protein